MRRERNHHKPGSAMAPAVPRAPWGCLLRILVAGCGLVQLRFGGRGPAGGYARPGAFEMIWCAQGGLRGVQGW